ncbi:MAG: GAF domain-containing protein [Deltaproteobacteria bacterium]|nr:GAF domain-containing protein [Deltaproteobacteria bacterium]
MGEKNSRLRGFDRGLISALESLLVLRDVRSILATSCELLGVISACDKVIAISSRTAQNKTNYAVEWSKNDSMNLDDNVSLQIAKELGRQIKSFSPVLIISDVKTASACRTILPELERLNIKSLISINCLHLNKTFATIVLLFSQKPKLSETYLSSRYLRVAGFIGYILSQTSTQRSMLKALDRYQTSLDYCFDAIVQYDLNGEVIFTNKRFETISGCHIKEIRGKHYTHVVNMIAHPDDRDLVISSYQRVLTEKQLVPPITYRLNNKNVERSSVQDIIMPVHDRQKRPIGYQSTISVYAVKGESIPISDLRTRTDRILNQGGFIILETDANFKIQFANEAVSHILDINPEELISSGKFYLCDLAIKEEREKLAERCLWANEHAIPFDEEFKATHRSDRRAVWLLLHARPVVDEKNNILAWDVYAFDLSSRRETQFALETQTKRLTALYTVSSAIRGYLDPANIAARGLTGLVAATTADAGVCYLYSSNQPKERTLSLVAHHGFSGFISDLEASKSVFGNLSNYVAHYGKSIVVPDLRHDPRVRGFRGESDELLSAILVPITVDDEILGTLGLFSRRTKAFNSSDVLLVGSAANQIGLAARQANLFNAYKRQTKMLAALYRISHELVGNLSLDEILQRAFAIISDELGIKRMWLGLLNELGTKIIGQTAHGTGWRRQLVHLNVDVSGNDHPFVKVIKSKEPFIVDSNPEVLEKYGLKKIFSKLAINSVVLVPLVARGNVLGIIAVQPRYDGVQLADDDMNLLVNLANEIGGCVLNKRLETQIAESEKMRTAGILAAGVAHNFNNLLQAVLGQASLLEIQAKNEPKVERAAKIIHQAAVKGAGLVKQLLSFSQLESPNREISDVNSIIHSGQKTLSTFLKHDQQIKIKLASSTPSVFVDPSQILRIVQVLVANAVDASENNGIIEVFSDVINISEDSSQLEVAYGRYVRIGIKDNGIGMDAETKRRCFEPFFSTKAIDANTGISSTGAGMGLAAANALARRNGARLVAESKLGYGSVFILFIPVQKTLENSIETVIDDEQVANLSIDVFDDEHEDEWFFSDDSHDEDTSTKPKK